MCKEFVTGALHETLTAEGVFDIVDYNFYPWGNAYFNTTKCGTASYDKSVGMSCWLEQCGGDTPDAECFTGLVMCQHGEQECEENLIEACAVYNYPDNVMGVFEFTYCLEGKNFVTQATVQKCANNAGLDYDKINSCANGKQGEDANKVVAQATAQLEPAHLGTPWVIVDGEVLDNPDNLLSAVCGAYTGPAPAGCPKRINLKDMIRNRLMKPKRC